MPTQWSHRLAPTLSVGASAGMRNGAGTSVPLLVPALHVEVHLSLPRFEAVKALGLLGSRGFSPVKMVPFYGDSLYGTEVPAPNFLRSFSVSQHGNEGETGLKSLLLVGTMHKTDTGVSGRNPADDRCLRGACYIHSAASLPVGMMVSRLASQGLCWVCEK